MFNNKLIPVIFLAFVYSMFAFPGPGDGPCEAKSMPNLTRAGDNKADLEKMPPPYSEKSLSVAMPDHNAEEDFKNSQAVEQEESQKRLSRTDIDIQESWSKTANLIIDDTKLSPEQKAKQISQLSNAFAGLQIARQRENSHLPTDPKNSEIEKLEKIITNQDLRIQCLECASNDGRLIWKITDYEKRKKAAKDGKTLSLYSQPFRSPEGYKMCARAYLNGDGLGKGTHLSLFFVVMKGERDSFLRWPFNKKVTFTLVDQTGSNEHLRDNFRPDPKSSSFKKPTSDINIASGCPMFVTQTVVETDKYLVDNSLQILVEVGDQQSLVKSSSPQPQPQPQPQPNHNQKI